MREKHILRYVCCAINILFIMYMATVGDNYSDDKTTCIVDSITYPETFDNMIGWIPCKCFTDFCIPICYCVNLFQGNDIILSKNYDINCTFQSNIIPYNLNFTSIFDTYYNKSIECWYDNIKEIYYLDGNIMKNDLKTIIISAYVIVMVCIFIVECSCSGYISMNRIQESQENEENLPRYDEEDIPPSYEEHEA